MSLRWAPNASARPGLAGAGTREWGDIDLEFGRAFCDGGPVVKIHEIQTERLRFSVASAGSGEPLMLVHGFAGAKEDFVDFLDVLADRHWHVIAPDCRGHGDSDHPANADDYSIEILAEDIGDLADALRWETFHLLGHSMGGMAAQEFALANPGRVRSLILMDTTDRAIEHVEEEVARLGGELALNEGMARLLEVTNSLATARRPSEQRLRDEREGYVAFGERKLLSSSPTMFATMALKLLRTQDRAPVLAGLDVATLVLVGEEDEPFLEASERLAATIPGAEFHIIPGASHCPQFENPDRWWKVVSAFLDAQRTQGLDA